MNQCRLQPISIRVHCVRCIPLTTTPSSQYCLLHAICSFIVHRSVSFQVFLSNKKMLFILPKIRCNFDWFKCRNYIKNSRKNFHLQRHNKWIKQILFHKRINSVVFFVKLVQHLAKKHTFDRKLLRNHLFGKTSLLLLNKLSQRTQTISNLCLYRMKMQGIASLECCYVCANNLLGSEKATTP